MKLQHTIKDPGGDYVVQIGFTDNKLSDARFTIEDRASSIADNKEDAELLLDVLLVRLKAATAYKNPVFTLQRGYDRERYKREGGPYPTYDYDLFDLRPVKVGNLRPVKVGTLSQEKFEGMSAQIRKVYSTSEPVGKHQPWVDNL